MILPGKRNGFKYPRFLADAGPHTNLTARQLDDLTVRLRTPRHPRRRQEIFPFEFSNEAIEELDFSFSSPPHPGFSV